MELRQFIAELKGRGVYRVTAIYCAGAWALLQVADIMFPVLGLPDWSVSAVLIASAAGFPVALVLAWLFDITSEGVVEAEPVRIDGPRINWSKTRIIELTVIVGLASLVGYLYYERLLGQQVSGGSSVMSPTAGRTSIAVMPFVNMSNDPDMEYLGDGLAEEILNLLAKLNELNVAARTSSFYFKNKNTDIRGIAESLGVGHVLEGSIRQEAGRIRVTAQLIEAQNGFHLWSETFDREVQDLLDLQDEISGQVVDSLQLLLSADSQNTLSARAAVDPVAYDLNLRGLSYLRLAKDESNLNSAIDLLSRAVELDPEFAEAHAALCEAWLGIYSLDIDPKQFSAAEESCRRALSLDRRAASVYLALGNLYRTSGQYTQALDEFNLSLSLNPGSADAHLGLADTYFEDNQIDIAGKHYEKALELQPKYWRALMSMGNYYFNSGREEKAIPYYQHIVDLRPDSDSALNNLGSAFFLLGDFEQASTNWEQSLKLEPTAYTYSNLATGLYFQGKIDESLPLYHRAVELAPENYEFWGNLGDAYRHATRDADLSRPMYENAIKLADNRLSVNANDALTLALMAHYAASSGLRNEAMVYIERAGLDQSEDLAVHYSAATAYAAMGESELALDQLERALALGYARHMVRADPNLAAIRDMPRFGALTAR